MEQVKIKHKDKKMAKMLEIMINHHMKESPKMYEDMREITSKIAFFNLKYGTNFTITSSIN